MDTTVHHVHHRNCTRTRTRTSDVRVCKLYFTHVHKHTAYALDEKMYDWVLACVIGCVCVCVCMEHLLMKMMTVTKNSTIQLSVPTTDGYRLDMEFFFHTQTHEYYTHYTYAYYYMWYSTYM